MKTRITLFALAFVLAFPQVTAAYSMYAMRSPQPIYFDAISLTGCPYPTSVSAFTGASYPTGTSVDVSGSYPTGYSYDTSDSYPTGYSEPTSESYPTGVSEPTSESYQIGTSYAAGVSAGPVGVPYATGESYMAGYSQATSYSVPTSYSYSTNHTKGTTYGRADYAEYSAPNFYNETPTRINDYSGYYYDSYYPSY